MEPSRGSKWIFKNYFVDFDNIKTIKNQDVDFSVMLFFENVKVCQNWIVLGYVDGVEPCEFSGVLRIWIR